MDIKSQYKKLQKNRKIVKIKNISYDQYINKYVIKSKPILAIIVPFREEKNTKVRINHLKKFVKHMISFFTNKINYKIFVIQQYSYKTKFNRGKLLNIGFKIAKNYNIIVTHDVDMLPDNYLLNFYLHVPKYPVHISYPGSSIQYTYDKYFGGINIYNRKHFQKFNGFPNNFWGWGGEDDALYDRIAINNLKIIRPTKGKIKVLSHRNLKDDKEHTNLYKWENRINNIKNWKINGLNNLSYKIINKNKKSILIIYTVEI